ncbi:hypothetical protein [Solimicrobium silvestre]|uniref:Uncharacterized protein n=1 Tax=Solimicrobium silvestre TaxID=2099400 RepID=A0A2S9GZA8_9BURK|nr:hypothetical protein [Solimicrobium silvestre]PRC93064.1 hypothetical protein S2091_2150 [Solimicrobium silvestre]
MDKTQATAMKRYTKSAIQAEKHLRAAANALAEMHHASKPAGIPIRGLDDTRLTLQENCREYANFLNSVFTKKDNS